jgi:hypothetical protein
MRFFEWQKVSPRKHGVWNGVRWDGQRASFFTLAEIDEKKGVLL